MNADYIGGFGITEPDAGSDVMSMASTAEDKGDHWLLNGSKTWISNANIADVIIYYAYTDVSKGSKVSQVVMPPGICSDTVYRTCPAKLIFSTRKPRAIFTQEAGITAMIYSSQRIPSSTAGTHH